MLNNNIQHLHVSPESHNGQGSHLDQQKWTSVTPSRKIGNQVVFRIKNCTVPKQAQRRNTTSSGSDQSTGKQCNSRKSHRKSRAGCGTCKKRRVKCDETKPHCLRCEAYGVACDYMDQQALVPINAGSGSPVSSSGSECGSIDSLFHSMSRTDLAARVTYALQLGSKTKIRPLTSDSKSIIAFHHFLNLKHDHTPLTDAGMKVVSTKMLPLAFKTPYLMHAILGIGATSISDQAQGDPSYKVLHAYHWQQTIRQYQEEIQTSIGLHNMDGLMSTCMFMSSITFLGADPDYTKSWVFSNDPADLNWLLIQGGLRFLLMHLSRYLEHSIWYEVFMESSDEEMFGDHRPGKVGLHPELAAICGITETTTEDDNPCLWPLRMLTPILKLESNRENFSKLMGFMGRLLPDYTNNLLAKEPSCLIILAYWLGKLCERPDWWLYSRAQVECYALCAYLESLGDPRMLELLEYPAKKCGYILGRPAPVDILDDFTIIPII
ncbi:C6 zinc finger domain-containing protein [Nannizzia gypsea CBS 118893]|uniref:C6 zinc finger domain-containing protein n=1 Tax=Arthroderma gypseum (strain ATCC MYA-4604 / CBS 118893) TaxID=535722 RepID=E4V5L9_ARTGP|nr:C6 zinc finger domain-containing protein [Nannizzia gypsea CBS 118893]EFR05394.1 C6 zinc finger domain-containing protein [Nannizzia gypsea CBS 118893]